MNKIINSINKLIESIKTKGYSTGAISDTFHTFDELYDHRTILFLALLKEADHDKGWYSLKHSDGSMFDGMFIAGFETPDGTITYHVENKYLPLFEKYVRYIPQAPEWDGHTPDDVLVRLAGTENTEAVKNIIGERNEG